MRSPILAAGAVLLAVPMLTLGVSVRPAAAAKAPKITSVTLSSRQIAANGAPVQIVALVTPNGNTISSVTATTSLSPKQTITLSSSAAGRYTGTWTVPSNASKKSRSVKVTVKVTYGNNKSVSKASANSTQLGGGTGNPGGGDSTPPPPPPI